MEMADFEGMPLSERYEVVINTWHAFSDTIGEYFAKETDSQTVADNLTAHLTSLSAFIKIYLEGDHEQDQEAIATVSTTILHLHQETFERYVKAYNLDRTDFSFVDDEQREDFVETFIEKVQEIEAEGDIQIDVPKSMYYTLSDALLTNVTTLLNQADYEYEIEEEKDDPSEKPSLKSHAVDIGKIAVGVFVGISAYALAQKKRKPKNNY